MTFQYRIASPADHEAIREVVLRSYGVYESVLEPEHWARMKTGQEDKASAAKLFQSATVFVCEDDEKMVGVVYLVPSGEATPFFDADWAHIRQLGVLPEYYGRGIATELMKCCIAHAKQTGEHTLAWRFTHPATSQRGVFMRASALSNREISAHFSVMNTGSTRCASKRSLYMQKETR